MRLFLHSDASNYDPGFCASRRAFPLAPLPLNPFNDGEHKY